MKNDVTKLSMNQSELQTLAQFILDEAKKAGASEAEVNLSINKGFSVSGRNGEAETVEYHQDKVIGIDVSFGKRQGSAGITDIRPEAVRAAVQAACHIATFTGEDASAGLADKTELAHDYPNIPCNFPWDISVNDAIEKVIACEKIAMNYDKRIMDVDEISLSTMQSLHVYANSHGFCGVFPYSRHEMSCVLVAKQNDDMQRDYSYTVSTDASLLKLPDSLAREAAERTVKRLGAKSLQTMKAPVIFLAEEARGLIGHFAAAISGGSIYRKSSFLVDHLEQKVFPDWMTIYEDPFIAKALGSAPFDADGVATRKNTFVEAGVLKQYALSVYTARKLNMQTTGNAGGFHNLIVKSGSNDLKTLLKKMDKGLLVTEIMGNGVNLITGDYSRGVGGYWVENGEIQFPVHEVTIAGRLQDMYANMIDIANDIDARGNIRTGSILIEEMMIAGS